MSDSKYIDRPPRLQPSLPFGEHEIPRPPDYPAQPYGWIIQIALPVISVIAFGAGALFGSPTLGLLLVIPMALSAVASYLSFRQEARIKAQIEQSYSDRLVELHREMHTYHDMQRRAYHYNYPDVPAVERIVRAARAEIEQPSQKLRTEARLWERRVDDADFGFVRLGLGTIPSTVKYKLGNVDALDSPQMREALKLEEESLFVTDAPVIISLRKPREQDDEQEEEDAVPQELEQAFRPPYTHALGIAGQRGPVYEAVRALLGHYVVFHAPMDAKLYVLASERQEWLWTEQLPHSKADEQNKYHCFVREIKEDPEERAFDDDDGGELEQFLEGIRRVLAQRKIRMQDHDKDEAKGDTTLPHVLVIVDLLDATYDSDPRLREIESDAAISILLAEGAELGASVIFLVPERSKIPSGCRSVLEVERTTPATSGRDEAKPRLHFRFAETGVNSARYIGTADLVDSPAQMQALADDLAAVDVRQGFGANLATTVPFLDLMGFSTLSDLKEKTREKWQKSTQANSANWLRVKLGKMSGNKPRTLVMSAKRDGVHGMVAGSTGSGKSELLISLICGLAITYDPSVLNFVLVDYKGGSAFNEFKGNLPHCVDVITNLGEDGVTRMFTSIKAEMERRQKLNIDTDTKDIVEYRRKGKHLTHGAYPYLFIIIDEFAEMIAARAEYRTQLETITRLGRAQGVSLILAAQRPSGVSDQMRSNIKFRISLRVETPGESREMLRRSDAAFLPTGVPGRGYLQVGNDEIELIQVAYSGDRYTDPSQTPQEPVIWLDRGGQAPLPDQDPPELYVALIDMLKTLANDEGVTKQRAPWPDFLPRHLWLSQLLVSDNPSAQTITSPEYLHEVDRITLGRPPEPNLTLNPSVNKWFTGNYGWLDKLDWQQYAMRPVVGLVDNPYEARQLPLVVDLPRGNAMIVGAAGRGKTAFIRTLVASLAATHSPDHFHAYLLDLGGRNLQVLGDLPHVGALIMPDEEGYEERVAQLLRELDDIVDKRKVLFNDAQALDLYEYNQKHPQQPEPAILLAIDNFLEFKETFGGDQETDDGVLTRFVTLARLSKPYGIHFLISVNQIADVPPQLYNLFTERFALKLADPTEYRAILGESVPDVRDVPGRGYLKTERYPLAFQAATVVKPEHELARLGEFVERINVFLKTARAYRKPVRVDGLAKAVLFKQLLAREHHLPLDEQFIAGLRQATARKWAESVDPKHADWLKVTLGLRSGDHPRTLELEAKKDGVHGLIAGGTGAGKSELLMTMICGLALNYDPSILNFLLVDYKGGGAFKPFEQMPHVVDVITNLNKSAVKRVFTTISAEMERRQKLNADTGTADIVEYRKKGMHLTHGAYPHLFIIIDEYAEMISDNPEFREELDSITRVGRAQGVNLILASQRPVGVSDQMRANIKLRICLRVEGIDTSREMLRRPDAALLPNGLPGRGYIQVGNETIELVQVAYTGEPYPYADVPLGVDKPKFYSVLVDLTNDLLHQARPLAPWPPALPTALTFADALAPRYLDRRYEPLVTLGRTSRLALNPFLDQWLTGNGTWPGVSWNETAMRAVAGLLDDPYHAQLMPLVVDFSRGHAVLFGAAGWGKTTFLRSTIMSLAATHSPDEFQAHVLDLGGAGLDALGALPHVGTVIKPDESGYEERVQQLWRELNDIVNKRKQLFNEAGVNTLYEYNHTQPARLEPAILVAIDNFAEYIETFGNIDNADDPNNLLQAFVALARQGISVGLHFAITVSRLQLLNSKLYSLFTERLTLRLAESDDYSGIVGYKIPDIDEINGRGYTRVGKTALEFQIALLPPAVDEQGQSLTEKRRILRIGEQMQAFIERSGHTYQTPLRIGALPQSLSFRQVLARQLAISSDVQVFARDLKAAMRTIWDKNATADDARWLYAPLGIVSGNRTRTLQFEAKKDGVHGLIAGGTGSGKSELLMTMICGLAVNFSPDILNFILVDYKGGGAFKPFEQMPHVVDIVTNLNKAGVDRMFTAINAEIRRRQGLNARTGTKDIVEYRKKGLHLTDVPYPHLFIIIDEYSEMIDDNPDYRLQLDSITRVGRAQGVNLILASQQPKGVSDQMRANIKLRLCLRVEQTDTSRELLRRPDAALLPNGLPGRGYMQIGNENLELIQVAYSGEPQPYEEADLVVWPDRPEQTAQSSTDETPRLFDAVVALAADLYGKMAPKPWPNFLPEHVSLETPIVDAKQGTTFRLEPAITNWLNGETEQLWPGVSWSGGGDRPAGEPIVGLLDDPAEARQDPLRFDLGRGHLAIFGDSGFGKTSLLRSLIVSLAATHSPNEFHAYILDLGGRNLKSLEDLPHVGAVIYADEEAFEERLQRLVDKLEHLMEERQRIFSTVDANTLYDYNAHHPDRALPMVLVVIDNFAELQESQELLVETRLMPLIRASLGAGITFAVAANIPNNMPSKLYNLFGERITFRQSDSDRYMDIVGRGAAEFGDIPGRGYIRRNQRPLLFHIAESIGVVDAEGTSLRTEGEEIRQMAGTMRAVMETRDWRSRPTAITTLPLLVELPKMLEAVGPAAARRVEAILGQDDRLLPALFDLKRMGPHFTVTGPPLSGKSTVIYNWVLSLAERYDPSQVMFVLIDLQRRTFEYGGAHALSQLPHVLASVSEPEELEALTARLRRESATLATDIFKRSIFVVIDNYDDFSEETEAKHELIRELATLARRYGRDGLHFIIAGMLDGTNDDLARRVKSAGYGIGLRNARALENLGVHRLPTGLDKRELQVGRGYIVKMGQTTMIQIASPYEDSASHEGSFDGEDESQVVLALDRWVARLLEKYPDQKAAWSIAKEATSAQEGSPRVKSGQLPRMAAVLRAGMLQEIARLKEGNGHAPEDILDTSSYVLDEDGNLVAVEGDTSAGNGHPGNGNGHPALVLEQLLLEDPGSWNDEETIVKLLRELWVRQQRAAGLPAEFIDSLYRDMDTESLLHALEGAFSTDDGATT
ncbi:MAG TPA: FtsK/SpoIIIE domain-containing protein [Herpetosiphonaceae bacterium]